MQTGNKRSEVGSRRVSIERSFILPCLIYHELTRARRTLVHIVIHFTLVGLRCRNELTGRFCSFGSALSADIVHTVQTNVLHRWLAFRTGSYSIPGLTGASSCNHGAPIKQAANKNFFIFIMQIMFIDSIPSY